MADFILSGYDQETVDGINQIFVEILARYPHESKQRLLIMAINRLFHDLCLDDADFDDPRTPAEIFAEWKAMGIVQPAPTGPTTGLRELFAQYPSLEEQAAVQAS